MKRVSMILCLVLLFSCSKNEIKKPEFIIGQWIRLNDKENRTTYEIWNSDFNGIGFTLHEKDTVFKEVLSIIKKNDSLYLSVTGINKRPTLFKFTSQTDTSFICENLLNEFPKKIQYALEKDTLKAQVSNPNFGIEFVFIKK